MQFLSDKPNDLSLIILANRKIPIMLHQHFHLTGAKRKELPLNEITLKSLLMTN